MTEPAKRARDLLRGMHLLRRLTEEEQTRLAAWQTRNTYALPAQCAWAQRELPALQDRWAAHITALIRTETNVSRVLEQLPPQYALLLRLRYFRGLSWLAVASRLYVCERTARRWHLAALAAFADHHDALLREGALLPELQKGDAPCSSTTSPK